MPDAIRVIAVIIGILLIFGALQFFGSTLGGYR